MLALGAATVPLQCEHLQWGGTLPRVEALLRRHISCCLGYNLLASIHWLRQGCRSNHKLFIQTLVSAYIFDCGEN